MQSSWGLKAVWRRYNAEHVSRASNATSTRQFAKGPKAELLQESWGETSVRDRREDDIGEHLPPSPARKGERRNRCVVARYASRMFCGPPRVPLGIGGDISTGEGSSDQPARPLYPSVHSGMAHAGGLPALAPYAGSRAPLGQARDAPRRGNVCCRKVT
jgi:hypothetical protein